MNDKAGKITVTVVAVLLVGYLLLNFVFTETMDYYAAVSDNTVTSYVSFRDKYPESRYISALNQKKALLEESYFERKRKKDDLRAYNEFLHAFPADVYTAEATRLRDSILQIESDFEKWGKNSLEMGEEPYKAYWGGSSKGKSKYNSDIVVQAPVAFDMVAIVREKNEEGKVFAHAYVKADSTYTIKVDNGTYQLFFYIGKGWNPTKKMGDKLGGFVRNETYSKDEPVNLANEVINYKLSMKLKKKKYLQSSRQEMFGK